MKTRRTLAFLLAALMCLSLCACGSANKSAAPQLRGEEAYDMEVPMPAPEAAYATYDMAYESSSAGFGAMQNSAARKDAGTTAGTGSDAPEENPEKIIYSGDATVETTEFDKSIEALEQMIADIGGFIESSSVNGSNYYDSARSKVSKRTASYTLRVPSEKFASLMGSLSDIGNVPYTHTYTENVTAQYYDTAARLAALEKQEARLIEMLGIAETVEDIITIEDKLTDVRYRIDSLQSSLKNWDRRVAYSTLSVTVKEVQVYTPETVTRLTYGQELVQAFTGALKNAGQFFKDLLVFLVSSLPTIVILAVLFFVFRPLIRRLMAKNRARRAEKKAPKAAPVQDAVVTPEEKEKK